MKTNKILFLLFNLFVLISILNFRIPLIYSLLNRKTGVTSGAGTAYHSEAPEFTSRA